MLTLVGHTRTVRALAYAPGPGTLLASGGDDRTVRLWNPAVGPGLVELDSLRAGVLSLAFAPDGGRLLAGGRASATLLWDVTAARTLFRAALGQAEVVSLAITADGRTAFAGLRGRGLDREDDRLVCWDWMSGAPAQTLSWPGEVECATYCPSRDRFAIAGRHGVELWDVGRPRGEPLFRMPGWVNALAFSPDEGRLLAVAGGRSVGVRGVDAKSWRSQCDGHKGDVLALAFSPDGRLLLTGGMDRTVRLWETLTGRQLAAWDWKVGIVHALSYAPDGMTAAVAGQKPHVVVWDVDEG